MPDFEVNLEGQIASELTRADMLTLISGSIVKKKHYHITDAVNSTRKIAVFYRTSNSTTFWAYDVMTGQRGKYFIVQDLFFPLAEPQGAVLTYVNLASFPLTGAFNTVYIAQDTGNGYTWDGANYDILSGGTVFATDFASLPLTGAANTLYITTDDGNSYLWDGAQYVQTSNGNPVSVESVTGDSVDNTDPTNPVVNAIPLSGTTMGNPVTGDIEVDANDRRIWQSASDHVKELFFFNDQQFGLRNTRISTGYTTQIILDTTTTINVSSDDPAFAGLQYISDYSSNFTLRSLIDQEVLKKRFWTKAGAPTTSDDVTKGYIVGSIIFDTINSILHRCTNNSAGAAVWTPLIVTYENIAASSFAGTLTFPNGSTRYYPVQGTLNASNVASDRAAAIRFNKGGTLSGAAVDTQNGQTGTGSMVWTLFKGASLSTLAATTIVVTIPAGGAAGTYTSGNSITVNDGDYLVWQVVNNGTNVSAIFNQASMLLTRTS